MQGLPRPLPTEHPSSPGLPCARGAWAILPILSEIRENWVFIPPLPTFPGTSAWMMSTDLRHLLCHQVTLPVLGSPTAAHYTPQSHHSFFWVALCPAGDGHQAVTCLPHLPGMGTTTGTAGFPAPPRPPQTWREPEHPRFSGHRLANGLLICSIVPCEANSISARDSSLPVSAVMDRTSGCHRRPQRPLGSPGSAPAPPPASRPRICPRQ